MTIVMTIYDLVTVDACNGQVRAFNRRFGERVVATVSTAVAHADVFDWEWAAQKLLSAAHLHAYLTEVCSWPWSDWRDARGAITHDGYRAHARFVAAAFAKAFLAQGGVPRSDRFR